MNAIFFSHLVLTFDVDIVDDLNLKTLFKISHVYGCYLLFAFGETKCKHVVVFIARKWHKDLAL